MFTRRVLLEGNGRTRVHGSAVRSDFSLSASKGFEVAHLDGTEGVLTEKVALVPSKVLDYGLIRAGSAPECLVTSHQALTPFKIPIIDVVELVRGYAVQIVQFEWVSVYWTSLGKVFTEVGIGVGVIEEQSYHSASDSAKCVST